MSEGFLLSRLLLRFDTANNLLLNNLSGVALTPDGNLWLGADEGTGIERFSPLEPSVFGQHQHFELGNFIPLNNQAEEIDIEGLDYDNSYLWLVGSHSFKRKKPKGKDSGLDIERLSQIKAEQNRYLLARIPMKNGELVQSFSSPELGGQTLRAAVLQTTENGNQLMESLKTDEHLGLFISTSLPSKENGLDIEGLAVDKNKIFLGLRGPVLRGFAIILELEVEEKKTGVLSLKEIGEQGKPYRKHFFELMGLGIRDLCLQGENLIILAGPTMDLSATSKVYLWKNALTQSGNTITYVNSDQLEVLFDIPVCLDGDKPEGLELFNSLGQPGLLVVYDSPNPGRILSEQEVFADIFHLSH
ncbi:MAG: DUF3616 domain-containing protein [Planktothrix sp. GU0601_MAG3]|nr:MAG: DUF3616 domain-containing protein [Planktothrix sp. GU0601_MAG3]